MSDELVGVTIEEQIGQALKKMPVTDAIIKDLREKYLALKTKGVDDKESYNAVYSALQIVVKARTSIEATRKILKADALKFGTAVDTEARRLIAMVEPIESHLYEQRMAVDNEIARRKALKDAEEQERYQGRAFKLAQLGMSFDGNIYKRNNLVIVALTLKKQSDEDFAKILVEVQADYDKEQAQIAEIARLQKEEDDRIAAKKSDEERKEKERRAEEDRLRKIEDDKLAAERVEIEKIKKEQADKEAIIKAAQDKLDAEKKAIDDQKKKEADEKRHTEEIEKAKKEAAEQAIKDEQKRVDIEVKEKIERDRLAAIEAEEKKAQMTDKEKLKELLTDISKIVIPEFKSKKARHVGVQVQGCFTKIQEIIKEAL